MILEGGIVLNNRSKDVRRGITNAKFNEENRGLLIGEIILISIVLGVWKQSWWVFGGVFFGLLIALSIKPLAAIICFTLSLLWGLIGVLIGGIIGSNAATVVLGLIGFMAGLGTHMSAIEWMEDIGS